MCEGVSESGFWSQTGWGSQARWVNYHSACCSQTMTHIMMLNAEISHALHSHARPHHSPQLCYLVLHLFHWFLWFWSDKQMHDIWSYVFVECIISTLCKSFLHYQGFFSYLSKSKTGSPVFIIQNWAPAVRPALERSSFVLFFLILLFLNILNLWSNFISIK